MASLNLGVIHCQVVEDGKLVILSSVKEVR